MGAMSEAPPGVRPDHARGLSLWLAPQGEPRQRLLSAIERLAAHFGGEVFQPHLTLVAGLDGEPAPALETVRRAAGSIAPITLRFAGVEGLEAHFRCLFLRAHLDRPLRDVQALASRAFGREPEASFLPHLSLFYGRLAAEQKAELALELRTLAAQPLEARELQLWRTQGPVDDWRELGRFRLGQARPRG